MTAKVQGDVYYRREAAKKLESHYKLSRANLRATMVKLILDSADALESGDRQ